MSSDPNKKTPRTFQCRDMLWDTFQQMAQELECSVDYLVNEAMKQYARQRYGTRTPYPGGPRLGDTGSNPPIDPPSSRPLPAATPAPLVGRPGTTPGSQAGLPPSLRKPPTVPIPARPPSLSSAPNSPLSLPMSPPASLSQGLGGLGQTGSRLPPLSPLPPAGRSMPPPLPRNMTAPPHPFAAMPSPLPIAAASLGSSPSSSAYAGQLSVVYAGERLLVNKDRFIIGRGKQSSDLTIKDPNVSRQHAMVEFLNGQYYMVDMGSTNGVEFNGTRVARRPIVEGDVYKICDHEVRFTYR